MVHAQYDRRPGPVTLPPSKFDLQHELRSVTSTTPDGSFLPVSASASDTVSGTVYGLDTAYFILPFNGASLSVTDLRPVILLPLKRLLCRRRDLNLGRRRELQELKNLI